MKCGKREDIHIHHKNQSEKFSHRIWSYSEPRIIEELAKCEFLCGRCHREHHDQQRLTEKEVKQIKLRIKNSETHKSIAKDFGIDRSTVSKIGRGEIWSRVELVDDDVLTTMSGSKIKQNNLFPDLFL